ncbi:MAG TPA: hypothetical protein VEI73_16710 [Candidatus Acidoferrum sp.]|nr:hypothetical protein [Candidatus Acidoferrum sp.]
MTAIWDNPEFIRNVRAQLRPGKVAATTCICVAISLVIGFAISNQNRYQAPTGPYGWGIQILQTAFWLQALMLAAGGGIACINSIHREKEQNTFDYQRVTRMTPLELAVGKLFGAPVFTYFVFLCLMPLALYGMIMGRRPLLTVAAAYAVLLVASIAVHALALLISLLSVRGSHTAGILVLLVLLGASVTGGEGTPYFQVHPFGPFYAPQIAQWGGWQQVGAAFRSGQLETPWAIDVFFGQRVHHVPLLLAIDLLFAGWFLLAVVRNIKRDPNYYEIYSPLQALGFAMFINLLFVAFFRWSAATPMDGQSFLLTLNIVVFFALGIGAIRNRERMRRILRSREPSPASWLDLTWPAPLMIAGTAAAGLLVVLGVTEGRNPLVEWNVKFSVVRVLFFVLWITRDLQFLQWMSLRRGKHPLVMGVLFLVIFYVCALILMAPLGIYTNPERAGFSAFFYPSAVYLLDHSAWFLRPAIWGAALVAQGVLIVLFLGLQRQAINELNSSPTTPAEIPVAVHT